MKRLSAESRWSLTRWILLAAVTPLWCSFANEASAQPRKAAAKKKAIPPGEADALLKPKPRPGRQAGGEQASARIHPGRADRPRRQLDRRADEPVRQLRDVAPVAVSRQGTGRPQLRLAGRRSQPPPAPVAITPGSTTPSPRSRPTPSSASSAGTNRSRVKAGSRNSKPITRSSSTTTRRPIPATTPVPPAVRPGLAASRSSRPAIQSALRTAKENARLKLYAEAVADVAAKRGTGVYRPVRPDPRAVHAAPGASVTRSTAAT